jgi:Bacterial Ig-like domain (group 3)
MLTRGVDNPLRTSQIATGETSSSARSDTMSFWSRLNDDQTFFEREQRTRRMNLQWLRHGNRTRTGIRGAGLALAALMISTWTCTGADAWAQAATRTQLSSAREAQGNSTQTVFTAKVADVSGNAVSSGTVSFVSAKGSIGSAAVESGTATLKVDNLPPATSSVTAVYSGDESHSSSSAAVSTQADASSSSLPDFSVTANPTSLSVSPGGFATSVLTITPLNGFSEMVTLSCSGVPAVSTCVFSPTTATPLNGAVATSSLQIQTQGPAGQTSVVPRPAFPSTAGRIAYAVVLPGMLALAGLGALRRRSGLAGLRVLGFVALLAASGMGLSSCAARYNYLHKPPAANPGIGAGTYNITVAAYANNGTSVTSHTLNLTLVVK